MVKTCPSCDRPAGALYADTHCKSKACTWSKCNCGATYDRNSGAGYANTPKPVWFAPVA